MTYSIVEPLLAYAEIQDAAIATVVRNKALPAQLRPLTGSSSRRSLNDDANHDAVNCALADLNCDQCGLRAET